MLYRIYLLLGVSWVACTHIWMCASQSMWVTLLLESGQQRMFQLKCAAATTTRGIHAWYGMIPLHICTMSKSVGEWKSHASPTTQQGCSCENQNWTLADIGKVYTKHIYGSVIRKTRKKPPYGAAQQYLASTRYQVSCRRIYLLPMGWTNPSPKYRQPGQF